MDDKKLKEKANFYQQNGYLVIEDFLTKSEVEELKNEVNRALDEHMEKRGVENEPVRLIAEERFDCGGESGKFFIDSLSKLKFFHEICAHDEKDLHNISAERRKQLYERYGHGLHVLSKPYNKLMTSDKMRKVFASVGYKDPVAVYGAILFKNAEVGRKLPAHQDGATIFTDPDVSTIGGWIALDDANEENGCLEFWPGSHKIPVLRKLKRVKNRKHKDDPYMEWVGPEDDNVEDTKRDQFVKVPTKSGSLVLLHGNVYHRTEANRSQKPRWAYTFHGYDAAQAKWGEDAYLDEKKILFLHINNKAVE